jgi:hypothetical protein
MLVQPPTRDLAVRLDTAGVLVIDGERNLGDAAGFASAQERGRAGSTLEATGRVHARRQNVAAVRLGCAFVNVLADRRGTLAGETRLDGASLAAIARRRIFVVAFL